MNRWIAYRLSTKKGRTRVLILAEENLKFVEAQLKEDEFVDTIFPLSRLFGGEVDIFPPPQSPDRIVFLSPA